jgi:hypothetical protein
MGVFNTPHPVEFTRRMHGRTIHPPIRKLGNQAKGVYKSRRLKSSAKKNNSRRVVAAFNENETRRQIKKAKRKAKEWRALVALINTDEIRDNIGISIDEETGQFISTEEGEDITDDQYELLIEDLQQGLDPNNNDDYDQKVLKKTIRYVEKARNAQGSSMEMANGNNS